MRKLTVTVFAAAAILLANSLAWPVQAGLCQGLRAVPVLVSPLLVGCRSRVVMPGLDRGDPGDHPY
jgi:hypothetical protein